MGAYEGPTNFLNVGASPSLMLNFAREKSLTDQISGKDLVTFTRSSTGTYVGADGLIKTAAANEPRFDHDANRNCLGLLIEESRTNKLTNSGDFSGNWSTNNSTITADVTLSPDGISLADEVYATSSAVNTGTIIKGIGGFTQNVWHTFSVFWKAGTSYGFLVQLPWGDGANAGVASTFILSNGQLTNSVTSGYGNQEIKGYTIEKYPNDWWRVSITYRATGVPTSSFFQAWLYSSFESNGTRTTNLTSYFWGAQVEIGEFVTSYIPTSGSTVTRSADNAQITGTNFTDWYNQSEGTIFANFSAKGAATAGYPGVYWFNNNLTGSRGYALVKETGPQTRVFQRGDDAVLYRVMFGANISDGTFSKVCTFYTNSQIGGSQNNEFVSPTSITSPYSVNRLYIGYHSSGGGTSPLYLNSHLKQLIYYPVRISDIKLQQMTKVFS